MKRILAIILVAVLCFGLAACNNKNLDFKSVYCKNTDGTISLWDSKRSIEKALGPPDEKKDEVAYSSFLDGSIMVSYTDEDEAKVITIIPESIDIEMRDIPFPFNADSLDESFTAAEIHGPGGGGLTSYTKYYTKSGDATDEGESSYMLSIIADSHNMVLTIILARTGL